MLCEVDQATSYGIAFNGCDGQMSHHRMFPVQENYVILHSIMIAQAVHTRINLFTSSKDPGYGATLTPALFFCRSTSDPNIGEELQRHIEAPYFIPPGLSHLDLSWIFMGAPGPGASIHVSLHDLVPRYISVFSNIKLRNIRECG